MPPRGTKRVDTFRPFSGKACQHLAFDPAQEQFPILRWLDPPHFQSRDRELLPVLQRSEFKITREAQAAVSSAEREVALTLFQVGMKELWLGYAVQVAESQDPDAASMTVALVTAVLDAAARAVDVAKPKNEEPRPFQVNGRIKCLGTAPGGTSHPSGHSAMSYAAATILGELCPERAEEFLRAARNVALSRVICGHHFAGDVAAGARLGISLAQAYYRTGRKLTGR